MGKFIVIEDIEQENAETVLKKINGLIDDGTLEDWECTSKGWYRFVAPNWQSAAAIIPKIKDDCLVFEARAVSPESQSHDAIVLGEFLALLLTHVPTSFTELKVIHNDKN